MRHNNRKNRLKVALFFTAIIIYQIAFILHGVDFIDEGFLATFYDQMFKTPELHAYNFMFWLNGVIGSLWIKAFPGILSIRIAGVLVTTLTAAIVVHQLKNTISKPILFTSVFLVILAMNNDVKSISYNNLSALFYVSAIFLLTNGLSKDKSLLLFASGAVLGMSIFLRTPNITSLSLSASIPAYALLTNNFNKYAWIRQLGIFVTGFALSIMLAVAAMIALGHWDIYKQTLEMLIYMGKGDPNLKSHETNYGLDKIIRQTVDNNLRSIKTLVIFSVIALIPIAADRILSKQSEKLNLFLIIASAATGLIVGVYLTSEPSSKYFLIYLFTGISLFASFIFLVNSYSPYLKVVFLAGIIFMITYPIGSSAGIYTAGRYALWISFPVALDVFWNIRQVTIGLVQKGFARSSQLSFQVSSRGQKMSLMMLGVLTLYVGVYFAYRYPMFDNYDRLTMTGRIKNEKINIIRTTPEKSNITNELLSAIKKVTKPGDTTIIYDCMPLLHYLTETVPYLKNSHPILYEPALFKKQLDGSSAEYQNLPVIIRHNFFPMGYDVKWPEEDNLKRYPTWEKNKQRNQYMNDFITNNHYKLYWSNRYFDILVPPQKSRENLN